MILENIMAKLPLPLPIASPPTVSNSGSERAKKSGRRTLSAKRKTLLEELWVDELTTQGMESPRA